MRLNLCLCLTGSGVVFCSLLLWCLPLGLCATIAEKDANGDGRPEIVLENEFVRLTFQPHRGGRCTRFVFKPTATEFLDERGMLVDRLWQQSPPGELSETAYSAATRREGGAVSLALKVRAQSSAFRNMELEKVISVRDGSCAIEVAYRVTNVGGLALAPLEFGLWSFGCVGLPRGTRYVAPTTEGIRELTFDPTKQQSDVWAWNPARGWTGMVGPDDVGLVALVEFQPLQCFYWCPTGRPRATFEWRYEAVELAPNRQFTTRITLIPFRSPSSIAGAGGGVVGGFAFDKDPYHVGDKATVSLTLFSATSQQLDVALEWRVLPDGEILGTAPKGLDLEAGSTGKVGFDIPVVRPGTHALHARARSAGQEIADFFGELVVEKDTGHAGIAPLSRRSVVSALPPHVRHLERANRPVGEPIRTPHFGWSAPLAGGPIKAAFVVPVDAQRDVVELAERLSLQWRIVPWSIEEGKVPDFVTRDLLAETPGTRVVVSVGFPFGSMSASERASFLEAVRKGTGLVCVGASGLGEAEAGLRPIDLSRLGISGDCLPEAARPNIRQGELGYGRVARLDYASQAQGLVPDLSASSVGPAFPYYEYNYACLAKLVRWAARRDLTASIRSEVASPVYAYPGENVVGLKRGDVISLSKRDPMVAFRIVSHIKARGSVVAHFRGAHGSTTTVYAPVFLNPMRPRLVNLRIPRGLAAGTHYLDASLRNGRGEALDWAAVRIEVMGDLDITEFTTIEQFYRPGVPVTARATVVNRGPTCKAMACLRCVDSYQRTVASVSVAVLIPGERVGEFRFTVKPVNVVAPLSTLSLVLRSDNQVMAEASCPVLSPIPVKRQWEDVALLTWTKEPPFYLRPAFHGLLRSLGFNAVVAPGRGDMLPYLASNLRFVAYGGLGDGCRYMGKGPMREPCLSNPEVKEAVSASFENIVRDNQPYGPIAHAIGDESALSTRGYGGEVCFCDFCKARFRDWLRQRYGTIAALNDEWSTHYDSWEAIRPVHLEQAKKLSNPAPWVDFRVFNEDVWMGMFADAKKGVQAANPDMPFGFPNSFGLYPFEGNDYYKHGQLITFSQEYPYECFDRYSSENHYEILRSFTRVPMPGWIGYTNEEEAYRFQCWWLAFHGSAGASYFMTGTAPLRGGYYSHTHPLLTPTLKGQWVEANTRDLRNGIAKLLMHTPRVQPDIAFLYSQESMYLSHADGTAGEYHASREHFRTLVEDIGFQHNYVVPKQIAAGELANYRVLVLPHSSAVNDETLRKALEFAKQGGVVIADAHSVLADEHGRPRENCPPFEELFGVPFSGRALRSGETRLTCAAAFLRHKEDLKVPAVWSEQLANVAGEVVGRFEDGRPAIVVNKVARGAGIYLAAPVRFGEEWKAVLRQVLWARGVRPETAITRGGLPALGYEQVRFRSDRTEYLGILRDYRVSKGDESVTVTLRQRRHVYDSRLGKYLGRVSQFETSIAPGAAAFYALLSHRTRVLRVMPSARRFGQGEVANLAISVVADTGQPGDHVLRVCVYAPDGKLSEAYSKNVLAQRGKTRFVVPFALEEALGNWRVVAKDVATGVRGEARVVVTKR